MHTTPSVTDEASAPPKRQSKRAYVLALLILVLSAGVFAGSIMLEDRRLNTAIDGLHRFIGPGVTELDLDEAGTLLVFYENRSEHAGQAYDTPRRLVWPFQDTRAMTLRVTEMATGEAMEARDPERIVVLDRSGREGKAVWQFTAPSAGRYRVETAWREESPLAIYRDPEAFDSAREAWVQARQAEHDALQLAEGSEAATFDPAAVPFPGRLLREFAPQPVVLSVGPDPVGFAYFQVIGLKGGATVLALGFTASVLIVLLTYVHQNPLPDRAGR